MLSLKKTQWIAKHGKRFIPQLHYYTCPRNINKVPNCLKTQIKIMKYKAPFSAFHASA